MKARQRRWSRLDNASKIFLAARSSRDSKVFRLSCELREDVQAELLQQALDETLRDFPLFRSCLRRGIFWYYLEDCADRPLVQEEKDLPCSPLYRPDKPGLLFRVLYYRRRIHLEVFHSLTDGTGALWFLQALLVRYLVLEKGRALTEEEQQFLNPPYLEQMNEDSFSRLFSHQSRKQRTKAPRKKRSVYRVKGSRTPDKRLNIVEFQLSLKEALARSKALDVTLTIYLTALFVQGVFQRMPECEKDKQLTISVPINLRKRYGSYSARNFFAAVTLQLQPEELESGLTTICRRLSEELQKKSSAEFLDRHLAQLQAYEENPFLRIMPRVLKDPILAFFNHRGNRDISLSISNLGQLKLPSGLMPELKAASLAVAVQRPQLCCISSGDVLTVVLLSPFLERDWQELTLNLLRAEGFTVSSDANELPLENEGKSREVKTKQKQEKKNRKEKKQEKRREERQEKRKNAHPGDGENSGEHSNQAAARLNTAPGLEAEAEQKITPGLEAAAEQQKEPLTLPSFAQTVKQNAGRTSGQLAQTEPSAYPMIPLQLRPRLALKILLFISLLAVGSSYLVHATWPSPFPWPHLVVLGVINLWMYAVIIIRKRRNIAKFFVYHTVLLSLFALAWDASFGWLGWSINYAVPIIMASAMLAMSICGLFVRLDKGDTVLYLALAGILGMLPLLFLLTHWVTVRLPSFLCGVTALMLLLSVLIFRFPLVRAELARRFHI